MDVNETEPSLREGYARYFFSMMEARLHDDEQGQVDARVELEKLIVRTDSGVRQLV